MLEYIWEKYGSKRDVVFYNYVSESMMPRSFKEKLSKKDGQVHIVYEGSLASFDGDHYDENSRDSQRKTQLGYPKRTLSTHA